jgi:hypothetical protein
MMVMETIGTLNLKIARLQQHLTVLASRQRLSEPYPEHQQRLRQEARQTQAQLDAFMEMQQALIAAPSYRVDYRQSSIV